MASVDVAWSGQCPSREVQQDLCRFIEELARCSHSFFAEPPLECEETPEPPQIKHWDTSIRGRILVFRDLLEGVSAKQCGIEIVETEEETVDDELRTITASVRWPLLHEADLYGIEFLLYDPRDWENNGVAEDRMSFVFLAHQSPDLNGRLVMVEDHEECQYYRRETIKEADWYLARPSMTLRYYLEPWFDYFMGWIKYFFMPDLYYWHYDDMAGYDELKQELDTLLSEAGDKACLRQAVFEDMLERFEYEAVEWWNAFYGDEHNKKRVPRLRQIGYSGESLHAKNTQECGEQDPYDQQLIELQNRLKQHAAELREQGIPVDDEMRIDMDAFKGVVYPAEEVERDKAAVRKAKEIMAETPWDIENIRTKLRKGQGP